jgi:hypothetical protein
MPAIRRWSAVLGTLPLLLPAAAATAATGGTFNAPLTHAFHSTSGNWSGYAATGKTFTSVSATWTQPAVTCGSQTTYSSFWVGIDGDGSNSVEQTGTEADCSGGSPIYSSWYEMYPKYPVNFSDTVRPGDVFHASVTYGGSGHFTLVLSDQTAGWSHTVNASMRRPALASAEVIAEAPSSNTGTLPLADFGSVAFSSSTANGVSLASLSPDPITMASGGTTKAVPSSISSGGNFSVAWKHS